MRELIDLFHTVRSFNASCRMTKEQKEGYDVLNKLYNELSGSNVNHSVCSKNTLLSKIEAYIDAERNKNNKQPTI